MKRKAFFIGWAAAGLLMTGCSTADGYRESERFPYYDEALNAADPEPTSPSGDKFEDFKDNPFVTTSDHPISTFAVDADGASYGFVRRSLTSGYDINPSSVRIEEFLNYFTFDYPSPTDGETVAINAEVGHCPWNQEHLAFINLNLFVFLIMIAIGTFILHKTKFGRNIYAIGGNEQSAKLMGLPVGRTKILVYGFNGFCSVLAGLA